ncbi:MAG: hypothetical protein ACLQUW_12195 [Desulfobaccales bacterium]
MKFRGMVGLLTLVLLLGLAGSGLAQEKAFLWNGDQWTQLSYDSKVGYVKGIGNLADFEYDVATSKGKPAPIANAFSTNLKNKTVGEIVDQIDSYYRDNPGKLGTSVIEVILLRCAAGVCPPELLKK